MSSDLKLPSSPSDLPVPSSVTFLTSAFPAEFQLMVACLQAQLATAPVPDWHAHPLGEIDFGQLLAMCQHHEVTPLVYRTLQTLELGESVLAPFRLEVRAQTHWAFQLTQQLLAILHQFDKAQVPVFPHKGVILSQHLFGDVARRPTKDIDIVIPHAFYQQAKSCLQTLAYEGPLSDTGVLLDDKWETFYRRRMHHVKFVQQNYGAAVELHWRLSPDFRGSRLDDEVWNTLNAYTFFGVQTFAPGDTLLFKLLCEHGAAHHYFRLKWLFDAAVLIDRGKREGRFITPQASRLHNQMLTTQLLCQRLFALESLDQSQLSSTQRWLTDRILEQFSTFPVARITMINRYRFQFAMLNSSDPRLIWPVLRHYLYENDSFRWHTAGWPSYFASLSRLLKHPFKRS